MQTPLVSVIMPVYNVEKYLQEAVHSALNQTYSNIELILINDGSTDRTKEISLSFTDPRVKYYENAQNMGVLKSRNIALDYANGDYIAWLDSDDIALPERIRLQVEFLQLHPDHEMVGTLHQDIDGEGKLLHKSFFPTNDKDLRSFLLLVNVFCNSSTMIKSPLMKELKFSEEFEIAEDYDLWYRVAQRTKVANIPEFLTLYRVHGNNISITKKDRMFAIVTKLAQRILTDAGIAFTQKELEVHSKMLSFSGEYFESDEKFRELENWLVKLYTGLSTKKIYNNLLLFELITERWLVICVKTKRRNKLLFNKLIGFNPITYLKILYTKARNLPIKY